MRSEAVIEMKAMLRESDDLWCLCIGVSNSDIVLTPTLSSMSTDCSVTLSGIWLAWPWLSSSDWHKQTSDVCHWAPAALCVNQQEEVVRRQMSSALLCSPSCPAVGSPPRQTPDPRFRFMSVHRAPTSGSPACLAISQTDVLETSVSLWTLILQRTNTSSLEMSSSYREPPIRLHTTLLWSYRFWQLQGRHHFESLQTERCRATPAWLLTLTTAATFILRSQRKGNHMCALS